MAPRATRQCRPFFGGGGGPGSSVGVRLRSGGGCVSAGDSEYSRVLLKLSGEALLGSESSGIDTHRIRDVADEVAEAAATGVQMAVVVGGGNGFRGVAGSAGGMRRAAADHIGISGTVLNAMALQDALEKRGVQT